MIMHYIWQLVREVKVWGGLGVLPALVNADMESDTDADMRAATTNTTTNCRAPVDLTPFYQPSFTRKGPQDPPEPLVQRPSEPPVAEERPNPPAADCADLSLTHPN